MSSHSDIIKRRIISIDVSEISYQGSVDRIIHLAKSKTSSYVCITNVHMLIEAHGDNAFAGIVNNADLAVADGMPIVRSFKTFYDVRQERIAGMDLLNDLIGEAENNGLSVFFYGSTPEVLSMIEKKVKQDFPQLTLAGWHSPPFRDLTNEEEDNIINLIEGSTANMVFIALGCPKQERWMASMKGKINAVMIGLGGALPVYAGLQTRAPKWMQRSGLEWLYRLAQEPSRLWKRYLTTNSYFIYLYLRNFLKKRPKD